MENQPLNHEKTRSSQWKSKEGMRGYCLRCMHISTFYQWWHRLVVFEMLENSFSHWSCGSYYIRHLPLTTQLWRTPRRFTITTTLEQLPYNSVHESNARLKSSVLPLCTSYWYFTNETRWTHFVTSLRSDITNDIYYHKCNEEISVEEE